MTIRDKIRRCGVYPFVIPDKVASWLWGSAPCDSHDIAMEEKEAGTYAGPGLAYENTKIIKRFFATKNPVGWVVGIPASAVVVGASWYFWNY